MRHAKPLAFCCALALAGIANAQSLDSQVPTMTPDPYAQSMYGGAVAQRPSTRSLFVGTMATLLAQALGSGIGAALSQGLGGSITKWFSGEPSAGAMGPAQSMATHATSERETPTGLHAGVAYEVHLIGRDGTARAVDPVRHVFRTGDRFQVYYRPTLPGRVDVYNVNPQGSESRVDSAEVAAGQLAALGPYQFVDAKGEETLKLVLEPCSSPLLTAATRGIVKVGAAAPAANPAVHLSTAGPPQDTERPLGGQRAKRAWGFHLSDCGDPRTRGLRAKARTIRKTTMEGSTAFALDRLSNDEIKSGLVGARELQISLQHR